MTTFADVHVALFCSATLVVTLARGADYDVILRHGLIYDGSGGPPSVNDIAIRGDTIAEIGDLTGQRARP
jgi:hypothetical protein